MPSHQGWRIFPHTSHESPRVCRRLGSGHWTGLEVFRVPFCVVLPCMVFQNINNLRIFPYTQKHPESHTTDKNTDKFHATENLIQ